MAIKTELQHSLFHRNYSMNGGKDYTFWKYSKCYRGIDVFSNCSKYSSRCESIYIQCTRVAVFKYCTWLLFQKKYPMNNVLNSVMMSTERSTIAINESVLEVTHQHSLKKTEDFPEIHHTALHAWLTFNVY